MEPFLSTCCWAAQLSTFHAEQALKATFDHILSDSNFLLEGGNLGFGLHQEYLLNPNVGLGNLIDCLKGSDAIIQSVCHQLSLTSSLRIIHKMEQEEGHGEFVMINFYILFLYISCCDSACNFLPLEFPVQTNTDRAF